MKNLNGNIALTTVLVFSALFVFSAIAIIVQAMDFSGSTSSYTNQIYAENSAVTCLEEALYKISIDNTYGTEPTPPEFIITIDESSECSAQVDNTSGQNRVISIESTYRTANYNVTKTIQDITAEEWSIN